MDNKVEKTTTSGILRFSLFAFFTGLFFFSIGVYVGKKWSDRQYISERKGEKSKERVGNRISSKKKKKSLGKSKKKIGKRKKKEKHFEEVEDRVSKNFIQKSVQPSYTSIKPIQTFSSESLETESSESDLLMLPGDQNPVYDAKGVLSPSSQGISVPMDDKEFSLKKSNERTKNKIRSYTIQVAAYKTKEEAQEHVRSLVDKGFPAFFLKKNLDGDHWFRVNIGSFKTKKEALKYEKALKKQTWIKKSFIRRVSRPVKGR